MALTEMSILCLITDLFYRHCIVPRTCLYLFTILLVFGHVTTTFTTFCFDHVTLLLYRHIGIREWSRDFTPIELCRV